MPLDISTLYSVLSKAIKANTRKINREMCTSTDFDLTRTNFQTHDTKCNSFIAYVQALSMAKAVL